MENYRLNEIDKTDFFLKLSRTLYIGNLNENINDATLHKYFGEFGDIISISIKKGDYVGDRSLKVYAFIKYFDSNNVILAILKMNGVNIEGSRIRLGFGKSYPSKCVWINGINESGDDNSLLTYLADCGTIKTCSIDHINNRALVHFKEIVDAEAAINKIKNGLINGLCLRGDYASIECQLKFAIFFNKQNFKNYLSINNVDIQNTSICNVNEQKSAVSHYVEADNTFIASKEFTSQITCIWVNGIADSVTNEYLESHFSQFGPIRKCLIDRFNKCALLCFQEESHAQSAVTAMNGSYIEGKSVYVRLASLRCRACDISNINNDNVTFHLNDNTVQSLPYSACHVDPSCKCTINDETYPINISDPRNNSINVNNAQYTPQHKYLNTYNINIPKYSSKTNNINNSSITIIFNEYPPERLKPPTQYTDSDILSLPLPEFAKNISKELTSTSSRYSLSSNAFGNQDTYTFNVHHDEMINYGLGKTDNQDEKQDQNNNHPLKSNYKILESVKSIETAAELQNLFFEKAKLLQDVSNKHTPKKFIQSQLSHKFKDQQLSSSSSKLSTSGSSKYSLGPSASVIQSHYNSRSDNQLKIIPQNSKTPLLDSQILPSDPKLLIVPKCSSAIHGMISDINGLYLTNKNCTISNSMHTSDAINPDFVNPIPKDADRNKTFLDIGYKFRDEKTKDWMTTSNWLTNTPKYNCVEKLDHWGLSNTSEKEKESQKKLLSKQNSLDRFVAKNSIEPVVQPIFVDVEKSTNIDEKKTDNDIYQKSIASILLSLNKNYQNRITHSETKDKIKKTNCNEFVGSFSNNGNSKNNKSVYNNYVKIDEYKDKESQSISSTKSMECKSNNIKPNKIQGEVKKTSEYIGKHIHIKTIKEWKKPILYFDHHEIKNKYCKPKTILDSKSIEPKFSKCNLFEFDMFKIEQTINKKKELLINSEIKNKDCKFDKGPTTFEEEKQNLNILKNHENSRKDYKYRKNEDIYQNYSCFELDINHDNKSKKYIKKVDGNITSSYCSTENSLKRSVSNPPENHNDCKRLKTDDKTYKNDSTKTSKNHSQNSSFSFLPKPIKNIHNNREPENKNTSKLDKTPNQPGIRGWINGHSMFDILSNEPKVSISNKVKAGSTNDM